MCPGFRRSGSSGYGFRGLGFIGPRGCGFRLYRVLKFRWPIRDHVCCTYFKGVQVLGFAGSLDV